MKKINVQLLFTEEEYAEIIAEQESGEIING